MDFKEFLNFEMYQIQLVDIYLLKKSTLIISELLVWAFFNLAFKVLSEILIIDMKNSLGVSP
ncbi:MAG: hypothetical protein RR891_04815 [Clostridium sp.]